MRGDVVANVSTIRMKLDLTDPVVEQAWAELETFLAVSLRVIAKTNPSKLASEVRTVELSGLVPRKVSP